jgi:hypothetical protein
VCSLSCTKLSIGIILEFLCYKWKPYPRVVFRIEYCFIYMRNLLLVEGSDLRQSNQYILARVVPSCFHFEKMCLHQLSLLSKCSPRYLTSSSRGSCTLFIWTRGLFSLRVANVMWMDLNPLAFILNF